MNEKEGKNLPIEVNENKFLTSIKNKTPAITDALKRIGKIAGYTALGTGALIVSAGLPIIASGTGAMIAGAAGIGSNIAMLGALLSLVKAGDSFVHKSEPGLAFVSKRNLKNEISIFQDVLQAPEYMKGLSAIEKGELMGIQTLIGFQRNKINLKGTKYTLNKNGNKVYNQRFSTVTHGINLKNFEALQTLGYIKIDSSKEKPLGGIEKLMGGEYLFFERIGFGQIEGGLPGMIKEFKAIHSGTTKQPKKVFKKVVFRLTDKDIDFEELYTRMNPISRNVVEETKERITPEQKAETSAFRRIGIMFRGKNKRNPSVLSKDSKKIDIAYDKFGRPYLVYNARQSFGERMEERLKPLRIAETMKNEKSSFDETLITDVEPIAKKTKNMVIDKDENKKEEDREEI